MPFSSNCHYFSLTLFLLLKSGRFITNSSHIVSTVNPCIEGTWGEGFWDGDTLTLLMVQPWRLNAVTNAWHGESFAPVMPQLYYDVPVIMQHCKEMLTLWRAEVEFQDYSSKRGRARSAWSSLWVLSVHRLKVWTRFWCHISDKGLIAQCRWIACQRKCLLPWVPW